MKRQRILLFILCLVIWGIGGAGNAALYAQPVVSSIATVSKSHSTVTLRWQTNINGQYVRIRYGTTVGYEANAFPDGGIQYYSAYDLHNSLYNVQRVGGLRANTLYHFCPQSSTDNISWSACVDHTETTSALPAIHPAYPIAPTPVNVTPANRAGFTVRNVAANCSDLQTHIDAAATNLQTNGSIIRIPVGTECTGEYVLKVSGSRYWIDANVTTSTNTITYTMHGLSNNQAIKVSGTSPGSAGNNVFRQYRGLVKGNKYYVKVLTPDTFQLMNAPSSAVIPFTTSTFTVNDGTDTFTVPLEWDVLLNDTPIQVVTTNTLPAPLTIDTTYYVINRNETARTLQLSLTQGGAAIDITTTGVGTQSFADKGGTENFISWPPTTNEIIIRSAVNDGDNGLPPFGVRVTPEWESNMATIKLNTRVDNITPFPISFTTDPLAHNYRFEGLEFTTGTVANTEIVTTVDPHYYYGFFWFDRSTSNMFIDRSYIHGPGYPNRVIRAFVEFNGENSAVMNSHLQDLDYWSMVRKDIGLVRDSNSEIRITAGDYYGPSQFNIASDITFTRSGGGATGTGYVYYTMAGVLTVLLPTGMTGSCAPVACNVITSGSPDWPYNADSNPRIAAYPIGTITLVAGNMTAVADTDLQPLTTAGIFEGASTFIAGEVAGSTGLLNNYVSASGLPIHYDDNIQGQAPAGYSYNIIRNHIVVPPEQIWALPESNKLKYNQRQQTEWKSGIEILIRGNIYEREFVDVSGVANSAILSATAGRNNKISDVEVKSNIFTNSAGSIGVLGGRENPATETFPPGGVLQRVWIHNNLIYNMDQYVYRGSRNTVAAAEGVSARWLFEDYRIDHNTFYDNRGAFPLFVFFGFQAHEGLMIRNNIFWSNYGAILGAEACDANVPACTPGMDGLALLDTFSYDYVWQGNSVIAGYNSSLDITPRASKAYITTAFPAAVDAYLISEMPTNIEWLNVSAGNFDLKPTVSNKSGGSTPAVDGLDRGVDMEQLYKDVGYIIPRDVLNIAATTAVVPFFVPDESVKCYVGYGVSADPTTWIYTASNTDANRLRSFNMAGLTTGTMYYYRGMCNGTFQTATRQFKTK